MKINTRSMRHALIALTTCAALGAVATPAVACGGGWFQEAEVDHRVQGVGLAEKDLAKGRYQAAAASVLRMIPHMRGHQRASGDPIVRRAMRVLAVSMVRADGTLRVKNQIPRDLHGTWLGTDTKSRKANLAWSAKALRALSNAKKDDPTLKSELGEALAKLDGSQGEARKLLGELADKDLVSSAEGYAALAKLRAEHGDEAGRKSALKRCQAMAKSPRLCEAAPSGGNS